MVDPGRPAEPEPGKSDQYAIGYTHALSKRTNLYTSYSYTKNDDNVRLFNVGMRHAF